MLTPYALPLALVLRLAQTAVALEFGGQRRYLLFAPLPRHVIEGIRKFDRDSDQAYADVFEVAKEPERLRAWLLVALSLAGPREDGVIFEEALRELEREDLRVA